MASRPPVLLPAGEWVDLYDATGITVGTKLSVHNNGSAMAILSDIAQKPVSGFGYDNIAPNQFLNSPDTPDGVWAMSDRGSILQVEEA